MTGATCITAISKNTPAERFMRGEQGAAHGDVADGRKGRIIIIKKKKDKKTMIVSKQGGDGQIGQPRAALRVTCHKRAAAPAEAFPPKKPVSQVYVQNPVTQIPLLLYI